MGNPVRANGRMPESMSTLPSHRYFPGRISSSPHAPEACRDSVRAGRREDRAQKGYKPKGYISVQRQVVATGLWRRCSVPSQDVGGDGTGRARWSQEAGSRCNVLAVSCCLPYPNPVTWASLYKVTQALQRERRATEDRPLHHSRFFLSHTARGAPL